MPVALLFALAASLGLHAVALFGPDIELTAEPASPPLVAELRPLPATALAPPAAEREAKPAVKPAARRLPPRHKAVEPREAVVAAPAAEMPESVAVAAPEPALPAVVESPPEAPAAPGETAPEVPAPPRLPPHGIIRYRVDRGDSNFEIGVASQEWAFDDGRYRLHSVVETTGLVWLFRSLRIEMESVGRVSEDGLRPETFGVRRDGGEAREVAVFDWDSMQVRVGDRPPQALDRGAQDLLSLYFQMPYLDLEAGQMALLPVATGKKYGTYRLEVVGDEVIDVPFGSLRTRHLRAPGENATEFWLGYDYRMLPVKIRHTDAKGGSLVQVATEINIGQ